MPSSGDLPDPGFEPASLMSLARAGEFFTTKKQSFPAGVGFCLDNVHVKYPQFSAWLRLGHQ